MFVSSQVQLVACILQLVPRTLTGVEMVWPICRTSSYARRSPTV